MNSQYPRKDQYEPLKPPPARAPDDGGYSTLRPISDIRSVLTDTAVEPPSEVKAENVEVNADLSPGLELPANNKRAKRIASDRELLGRDRWLVRNGHFLTYIGLYLFSILVLFRPYELVSSLSFLGATAFYFALATLSIYVPTQIVVEGNLTIMSTEIKAVLALTVLALLSMLIAKDPGLAWETFNDSLIKAVLIFVVLVNAVRTRKRLLGLMWLSLLIGVYLSISALDLYMKGEFSVESYRIAVDVGGMFGNPNEMAMHFVMMTPLLVALGLASKNHLIRGLYYCMAVLFVAATMVTYSRGGFLGLLACSAVLVWKFGRKKRLPSTILSIVVGLVVTLAAPGNYGLRVLSIFIPSLDPVGSAGARREGLITSIIVTLRNPWGVGIGNSIIFGAHDHQTHNAFTQVSSELGLLGLVAYLVFMIAPFRKLGAIERTLYEADDYNWYYYLAIGLQASIIGYMVSSFFASVAYNWFIYYLIAYAVAFRRIYSIEKGLMEDVTPRSVWDWRPAVS